MSEILHVNEISLSFGGLKAVQNFSLSLPDGALYGLIGPNGAGKTTVFNLLTGVYRPDAGTISLKGRKLNGLSPHKLSAAGLARTFQNIRLFKQLTVLDNVMVATYQSLSHGIFGICFRTKKHRRQEQEQQDRAMHLLRLFELERYADELAGNLPYGHQRRLEIARALATQPHVLLLDEPAAGMNPAEKVELAHLIQRIRDEFNITILLIDHDMGLIMRICQEITVLDHGLIIAHGTPDQIQNNPKVIEAYLGIDAVEE